METKICNECQSKNSDIDLFCRNCGHKLFIDDDSAVQKLNLLKGFDTEMDIRKSLKAIYDNRKSVQSLFYKNISGNYLESLLQNNIFFSFYDYVEDDFTPNERRFMSSVLSRVEEIGYIIWLNNTIYQIEKNRKFDADLIPKPIEYHCEALAQTALEQLAEGVLPPMEVNFVFSQVSEAVENNINNLKAYKDSKGIVQGLIKENIQSALLFGILKSQIIHGEEPQTR